MHMKSNDEILIKAISFATNSHRGMCRKGTKTPYILHPMEAAAIVGSMTDDMEVIAAALLHDVLEDTDVTKEELLFEFGGRITELVCAESENKREGSPAAETWKLRKQETIDGLRRETRLDVKIIALGDKLSNIRAINRDYLTIKDALWERFNCNSKEEIEWYYRSVADAISELSGFHAWVELNELIEKTFNREIINKREE